MENARDSVVSAHRIVVKIGTKSVLASDGSFDLKTMTALIYDIKAMVKEGKELVLVTSGAVAAGMKKMGMKERPRDLVLQQVAAAVGQPLLLNEYVRIFNDMPVAQVLLTQQDLSSRKSYVHFSNSMEQMLKMQIVPILNENDVVSIDELVGTKSGETGKDYNFSDNDVLSALVAASINADLLIVMSDVDGLYTKHPSARDAEFLPYVEKITADILAMGQEGGKLGRGGMATKLKAAQICTMAGVWMIICHAKKTSIEKLFSEGVQCTIFKPSDRMAGKKVWMVFAANVSGRVMLDQGAVEAVKDGASLLLPGVTKIIGNFNKNDVIELWDDEHNNVLGKGIANLSSSEIERFLKLYQEDPDACKREDIGEIIHRENLAIFT